MVIWSMLGARGDMVNAWLERERERELRREGEKSLLAYVKGVDPYLK